MSNCPLKIGMLIGSTRVGGGGVPQAVRTLCLTLSQIPGFSLDIFSIGQQSEPTLDFGDIPVHLGKPYGPATFGYSPDLAGIIERRQPDLLHVHGLWMYPSIVARIWHGRTGRPYIVSPHGMLDPWALRNGFWKKRLARRLYEDAHLKNAACIHALCEAESSAIRAAGFERPVAVLPNGVDLPASTGEPPAWRSKLPPEAKILLFLGRLTPKKGVAELIGAWSRISQRGGAWHLVLVGPDEGGYGEFLKSFSTSESGFERIHLVGPAYGEERSRAYASADAFILPSISEGLPLAALEAMSMGLPALLSEQCNLPEAFDAGCALAIGTTEDAIQQGIETLFSLPQHRLDEMGARGRALVTERFDWETIAGEFASLYRRLTGPEDAGRDPSTVVDLRNHPPLATTA